MIETNQPNPDTRIVSHRAIPLEVITQLISQNLPVTDASEQTIIALSLAGAVALSLPLLDAFDALERIGERLEQIRIETLVHGERFRPGAEALIRELEQAEMSSGERALVLDFIRIAGFTFVAIDADSVLFQNGSRGVLIVVFVVIVGVGNLVVHEPA